MSTVIKLDFNQDLPDNCAICIEELKKGQPVEGHTASKSVNHLFHRQCFRDWMAKSSSCPTCRKKVTYERPKPRNTSRQENIEVRNARRQEIAEMSATVDRCNDILDRYIMKKRLSDVCKAVFTCVSLVAIAAFVLANSKQNY